MSASAWDRAIQAATDAIAQTDYWVTAEVARAALAAAVPFLREQIAREIEADFRDNVNDVAISDAADSALNSICNGMYRAARVARGVS